jgi:hypothetical protein
MRNETRKEIGIYGKWNEGRGKLQGSEESNEGE